METVVWAFGFMGYPGFFIGFIGGILFQEKKVSKVKGKALR